MLKNYDVTIMTSFGHVTLSGACPIDSPRSLDSRAFGARSTLAPKTSERNENWYASDVDLPTSQRQCICDSQLPGLHLKPKPKTGGRFGNP